jgi:uroporphyrinogen-III decarboxylase
MSFFLAEKIDFEKHNEQVRQLMAAYSRREHERVPVRITGSISNLISNPELNKTGYTFRDFFTNAEAQMACQLAYQHYCRHNLLCDIEMGLPEGGWRLGLDFQNSYGPAWFGCGFRFFGDLDVPDTEPILKEAPEQLYDWQDPDPFWGRGDFMKHVMEMYEQIRARCDAGLEFHGRPVLPPVALPGTGSDGVFTIACKLRGAAETMIDMYENRAYFHKLMDYITRNSIRRIRTLRRWSWDRDPNYKGDRSHRGPLAYADDSIAMLSRQQYKEFVLPYHRRIFEEFSDGSRCWMHLCGDATHHFKLLNRELNVTGFDTGFPVDHGKLRRQLGPDVEISGGPTVMLLKYALPKEIAEETKRICRSGVMEGKRFILIAANNLAPCTPIENVRVLYEAGKKYGRYGMSV